ncbi:MAG: hypothetical protein AB1898_17610 [Acidobacteriota bacterium]
MRDIDSSSVLSRQAAFQLIFAVTERVGAHDEQPSAIPLFASVIEQVHAHSIKSALECDDIIGKYGRSMVQANVQNLIQSVRIIDSWELGDAQ